MPTYVALLRGINVGGRQKLLMAELRNSFEGLSFKNIETYIQSGNIVFDSRSKVTLRIAQKIKKQISTQFGYDLPVVVGTAESFSKLANQNPLLKNPAGDLKQFHLTFFNSPPLQTLLQSLDAPAKSQCEFRIGDQAVFIQCAGRYSDTKLNNAFFESRLKVSCTTRNWKTVIAIDQMLAKR